MGTLTGQVRKTGVRERREIREEREVGLCWRVRSGFKMLEKALQPFQICKIAVQESSEVTNPVEYAEWVKTGRHQTRARDRSWKLQAEIFHCSLQQRRPPSFPMIIHTPSGNVQAFSSLLYANVDGCVRCSLRSRGLFWNRHLTFSSCLRIY